MNIIKNKKKVSEREGEIERITRLSVNGLSLLYWFFESSRVLIGSCAIKIPAHSFKTLRGSGEHAKFESLKVCI